MRTSLRKKKILPRTKRRRKSKEGRGGFAEECSPCCSVGESNSHEPESAREKDPEGDTDSGVPESGLGATRRCPQRVGGLTELTLDPLLKPAGTGDKVRK